ncbi:hypothetical protein GF324_13005 [bacterium]|nr:hypothetical protein [bacterium]
MEIERTIEYHGPFRLSTALNILSQGRTPRRHPDRPAHHHFSMETSGGAVEVRLVHETPDSPLQMRILGDDATGEAAEEAERAVRRLFSLTVNPDDFYTLSRKDPHLRFALAVHPGIRPLQYSDPFEGAVRAMIGLRGPSRSTQTLMYNLKEVCGIVPAGRPAAPPAFPGKLTLLSTPERLLTISGIPPVTLKKIRNLAACMVGDPDPLDYITKIADPVRARQRLLQLPGIDPEIADHLLFRAFGFQDMLFPHPRLYRAVQRVYKLRELPDETTVRRLAQPYIPWRSWWMFLVQAANETKVIV